MSFITKWVSLLGLPKTFVKNPKHTLRVNWNLSAVLLYLSLIIAFCLRVVNLNYNTPYNDEAIYVVIGNLGVLLNDYYSYSASNWMGGWPFLYPTMTALVYQSGGIIASRLLNVIFGVMLVEEIFILTKSLRLFDNRTNIVAAFIAAIVAGVSGVGMFVSRLATYDIPSFFFLVLGINELIKATNSSNGRYYFLAAVGLIMAFLIKIVAAVYFPVIVIVSYVYTRKFQKDKIPYWTKYFFIPLTTAVGLYILFSFNSVLTFSTNQTYSNTGTLTTLLATISDNLGILLLFAVASTVILLLKKKFPSVGVLVLLALILPVFHLVIQRYITLDKHLYLSVLFLSPIVGYGLSYLVNLRANIVSYAIKPLVVIGVLFYSSQALNVSTKLENNWPNTKGIDEFLVRRVEPKDRILTEIGASTILALQNNVSPTNITTFDWIQYSGYQDIRGYRQAVSDKYFKYIQLNGTFLNADDLRQTIFEEMEGKYSLVYKEGDFEIYERQE